MTRGTASGYLTQSQGAAPKPVWFLRVATGLSAPDDLKRVTSFHRDITWPAAGSDSYTSRPISVPEVEVGAEEGSTELEELRLGDADAYWNGLGADFVGKRVSVLRGDMDLLASTANSLWNDFFVDQSEWDHSTRELVLHLVPFRGKLRRLVPPDLVTRDKFPGVP